MYLIVLNLNFGLLKINDMLKLMCLPFQRLASEFLSQKEEVADNIKKTETFLALYGDRWASLQIVLLGKWHFSYNIFIHSFCHG